MRMDFKAFALGVFEVGMGQYTYNDLTTLARSACGRSFRTNYYEIIWTSKHRNSRIV